MKFSIKDFLDKCEQIQRYLRIFSHLLKKSLTGNFIFLCDEQQQFSKVFRQLSSLKYWKKIQKLCSFLTTTKRYFIVLLQVNEYSLTINLFINRKF